MPVCKAEVINVAKEKVVEEYILMYGNGILKSKELRNQFFYSSDGQLIKEIAFFRNKIQRTVIYLKDDGFNEKDYLPKRDSITYCVRKKGKDLMFYNGKLIDERYYDVNKNLIKEISYNINTENPIPVVEEFIYTYDTDNNKKEELFLWNKDTINEAKYSYGKDLVMTEKYYIRNKCCEGNQPIPVDKILYEYDNNKNLIRQIEITDKRIKREYKGKNNGYFNEVRITAFSYNAQKKVISKKIYIPTLSEDLNIDAVSLHVKPSDLSEESIYIYH
jgi:hypothetical protein